MAERYGWTPADTREMTWPQIRMYLAPDGDPVEPGGKQLVHFSGADCEAQYGAWNEQRQIKRVT